MMHTEKQGGSDWRTLMEELPKIYYDVVFYLVINNCSPKETAKMLNISEENVQVRFTQARQLLRQHAEA